MVTAIEAKIDPRDIGTPDAWISRHPELIRLTGRHPFNCEPPLEHLRTFITPTAVHYVRNHGAVPRLGWDSHRFQVDGLVDRTHSFTMRDLLETFQDQVVSLPVLLVCAGNRRKEQNMIKKSIGFNWGAGAASTAEWTGIPLHALLTYCGVDREKTKFVWFEGADTLPKNNYGTCIPARTALDPSCDVLVAWKMNGELLSPDHGFPLRLIVPGHIGGRMVKWLARIHVSDRESDNHHHLHDNRVLPSHIDAETATAENWWAKPEFAIQELNVNSVLLSPAHTEVLDLKNASSPADGTYRVSGYAYSGGGRRIIRVEVTLDDGMAWENCRIQYTEKPNAYGKMWCWVQYELQIPLQKLVSAQEICVRAWDSSMNTQPEYPTWNVMGMMNNPWFRVRISQRGDDEFYFEHPTQVGGQKEGWMVPGKGQTRPVKSSGFIDTKKEEQETDMVAKTKPLSPRLAGLPVITAEEVAKHTTEESCWFICRGLVYDATPFLKIHPGGASSILLSAGTDCTDEFESIHSTKAWAMLEPYCIGVCPSQVEALEPPKATPAPQKQQCTQDSGDNLYALNGSSQRIPLVLISKEQVSHDTRIFRFALPAKEMRLGLPTGRHVFLYAKINGKTVVRAYTPISSNDDKDAGFVSFLIKVYFAGENPAYPEGGVFTQHLESLHLGSQIEMKGPIGHFTYYSQGIFTLESSSKLHATKFGFIAGGTGITPIFQIMRAILTDPLDQTKVSLIYCVRTAKDLLLRNELKELQKLKPANCKIFFTLTELTANDKVFFAKSSHFGTTRINLEMIERVIGCDASHIGMCGPTGMIEQACIPALRELHYDIDTQVTIF
ncbi:Nitrate reductase [nadph], partial [Globisporangium splendens]